jgi:hypothetical protein
VQVQVDAAVGYIAVPVRKMAGLQFIKITVFGSCGFPYPDAPVV